MACGRRQARARPGAHAGVGLGGEAAGEDRRVRCLADAPSCDGREVGLARLCRLWIRGWSQ